MKNQEYMKQTFGIIGNGKIQKKALMQYIPMLGLLTEAVTIMALSPLFYGANSGTDSSVFRTIAMQMKNGLIPYKNSFDHKGPLLYLYNYLGYLLGMDRGILVVEFLSLFTAFVFMYKIARLKCERFPAFLVVIICITPLYRNFEGGNLTEEYALPFIASSLYVFADYFTNGRISRNRLLACGMGFGSVCLLRPNMTAAWIVFCCMVLMQCILTKHAKELTGYALYFLIGIGIIVIPICGWLIFNHAFKDFINDYLVFNMVYSVSTVRASVFDRCKAFLFFFIVSWMAPAFMITIYKYKDKELFDRAYLAYEIIGLLLVCMSGMRYRHYGMVFVPALVYPFAQLVSKLFIGEKRKWILAFAFCNIIIQVFIVCRSATSNTGKSLESEADKICTCIEENTRPDDKIIVWGNWNIIYVESGRLPASKYSYQFPPIRIDETIASEFFNDINETLPKAVVLPKESEIEEMGDFLNMHEYHCVYQTAGNSIYMIND